MEILQAPIFNAIKGIRSSKKKTRAPVINDTSKTLRELAVIENKASSDKNSYLLIDNINIADAQPHISTIVSTPTIENSTSN